ncbi:hypothetical protein WISP_54970 [Willisornis vidua]|uniref:DOCKER Lobe C domain-containing protein n=1 Tax=Willisornis vidua TaxID=1566151 RepID=A0ABQ9DI59_9PASS|nr:hypothetical protein WISP_54970 [Willisornis vidua]
MCLLQIPFLAEGIRLHGEKVTEALRPFHERMEACFRQLRDKVEKQYGVRALVSPCWPHPPQRGGISESYSPSELPLAQSGWRAARRKGILGY